MEPEPGQHHLPIPRRAVVLGAAATVGILAAAESFFAGAGDATVSSRFTFWILWAALTPAVFWLSSRWPVHLAWKRRLPLHVGAAIAVTALHAFAYTGLGGHGGANAAFPWGLAIYADLVLFHYAVDYCRLQHDLSLRAALLEKQLAEAELRALRAQLEPHFLFNALNSVNALLRSDPAAAERMLARVASFLRLTLDRARESTVLLRDEVEFIRAYLGIEQVRFRDRLSVDYEIAPEALPVRVPSLLLQPIVENAVRHGIGRQSGSGRILVRALRANGSVRIEVRDSGAGFSMEPREGVGLANTRARLEEHYGARSSLACANAPEGGAVVTVEVPASQ